MKDELLEKYLNEKGLSDWSEESIDKFAKTIGKDPKEHGFFDACYRRMSDHFSDEQARGFCAKIIDKAKGSTEWRKERGKK